MAINFCQEHHIPTISSSHVCRDGYEVHNLIATNQAIRKYGFCTEYFIRPPVYILLKFPIPIEISHILLDVKIGENQTTAVEIWSHYQPGNKCYDNEEKFELIGRKFNITENNLLFLNKKYSPRKIFVKLSNNIPSKDIEVVHFSSKHYGNLSSVGSLKISLIKTLHSGPSVLAKLEVWGQPAQSCKQSTSLSVLNAEKSSLPSSSYSKENVYTASNRCKDDTSISDNCILEDTADIPSDFIDPITCDLMTIPVILPSGHTIDRLTLEKYIKTEAAWGRLPNDPFTGIVFKSDRQPIPNVPLKVRIDQFLIKNEHLYPNAPRTVGNKDEEEGSGIKMSSLLQLVSDTHLKENDNVSICGRKRTLSAEDVPLKKHKQDSGNCDVFEDLSSASSEYTSISNKNTLVSDNIRDLQLSTNLDEALKATLSNYKSYTKRISDNILSDATLINRKMNLSCSICLSDAMLYRLSCFHILCRECLVQKSKKTQVICDKCLKPSTVANIVRVHV